MSRFFAAIEDIDDKNKRIIIRGTDVSHIKKVLRMGVGDELEICDGKGTDYLARIEGMENAAVVCAILDSHKNINETELIIDLYQGIPKSDKMDTIIQKSVELGVSTIIPVITERTVVRHEAGREDSGRLERWRRIALEAAKQCNRGIVPAIKAPVSFKDAVAQAAGAALSVIPYERERATGLKSILRDHARHNAADDSRHNFAGPAGISILIGPEGGFTENEIRIAENAGVRPASLGPRILRTETAGIAVISIIMYEKGDMG